MPVLMIQDKFLAAGLTSAQRGANTADCFRIGQRPKNHLDRVFASQLFQTIAEGLFVCFIYPEDASIGIGYRHGFSGLSKQRRDDLTQFVGRLRNGSTNVTEERIHEVDTVGRYAYRDSHTDVEIRLCITRDHPLLCQFVGFALRRQDLNPDINQVEFANFSDDFIGNYSSLAIANFRMQAAFFSSGLLTLWVRTIHYSVLTSSFGIRICSNSSHRQ